jgi:pre-mRNA-splicing factor ATP-dependent RNA helicase DHX38/PRP16
LQAGDDEHNPFAQWENIERKQEAEMEQKAVKRQTARQAQFVSLMNHFME